MLLTAYLVTSTRNKYGDIIAGGETALACHWRDITTLAIGNNEQSDADAIAWFEPDAGVERGSVVKFEGAHYRVDRIYRARKLRNSNVQFLKCELKKYGRIS